MGQEMGSSRAKEVAVQCMEICRSSAKEGLASLRTALEGPIVGF